MEAAVIKPFHSSLLPHKVLKASLRLFQASAVEVEENGRLFVRVCLRFLKLNYPGSRLSVVQLFAPANAKWEGANGKGFEKFFDEEAWRRFYQDFRGEKANTSHNSQSNFKETPPKGPNYLRSQHYTVLGLSRTRTLAYTDDEIKRAFRAKAKEVHPDQNPHDTKAAEKFKTLMRSYEALLSERKSKK